MLEGRSVSHQTAMRNVLRRHRDVRTRIVAIRRNRTVFVGVHRAGSSVLRILEIDLLENVLAGFTGEVVPAGHVETSDIRRFGGF